MAVPLSDIADVTISLSTVGIAAPSFSDMLILGDHVASLTRVMKIKSADDLLGVGIGVDDPLYLCAQAAFSPVPCVNQVYIGRRQVDATTITVNAAAPGQAYTVNVLARDANGNPVTTPYTYTATSTDTVATIATALAAAVSGSTTVDATAAGPVVTINASTAGTPFAVTVKGNLTQTVTASTEDVREALEACAAESAAWYGLCIASQTFADVQHAAQWAESNKRLFIYAARDPNCLDAGATSDVMSVMQSYGYSHSAGIYHGQAATDRIDCAWMSNRFTFYPGGENWANCQLSGMQADSLKNAQRDAVLGKYGNTYEMLSGSRAITRGGRVASGEWIDNIRLVDWLKSELTIALASVIANASGKVGYTNRDIAMFGAAMASVFQLGQARNAIARDEVDAATRTTIPGYTITLPDARKVLYNDKAERVLNDVKFTAVLVGAINKVVVKGALTY